MTAQKHGGGMIRHWKAAAACAAAFLFSFLPPAHASAYQLIWSSDDPATGFAAVPVPLGGFSDCNHGAGTASAYCGGLPAALKGIWWAYPAGWPDGATQRGLPVHGYYEPQDTTWVSDGQMHIRMFNNTATGLNESAALLPMKAFGLTYGEFTETFNISQAAPGFKSAHLLWPLYGSKCCEEDFPEADWDGVKNIYAFSHHANGTFNWYNTGVPFTPAWHTATIYWSPGQVEFTLDGNVIGTATTSIPATPEKWVLQNESALDGEQAAPGSAAQMNISYVAVYGYTP